MSPRRRAAPGGKGRDYPRTARLNELLREIVADALEVIDDERLELLTVTGVQVDPDLHQAVVYFDSLSDPDDDDQVLAVLAELRVRLQAAIGRQARLRRTPELVFFPDPAVRSGQRIDEILRTLDDDRPAERDEP